MNVPVRLKSDLGKRFAGQLAEELEVSQPTANRIITELRRRGYSIQSVRDEYGWRYQIVNSPGSVKKKSMNKGT